jgi:type IV pilus assembly protein PilA
VASEAIYMTRMIRRARSSDEAGFTLIELLVVIIIIGILAAIAIPVFLDQRRKGYEAAAKSDLRNLANFEELYLNDNEVYGSGTNINTPIQVVHPSQGVVLKVVSFTSATGYCLSAKHVSDNVTLFYDSSAGGLQPLGSASCPTVYATADGVPIP